MKFSQDPKFSLNAICPYFTMFPLEFPVRIIRHRVRENLAILDPFCGRGTTNYAAQIFGKTSYGIDSSPVAVAIAKAKLANTTADKLMGLVIELLDSADDCETPRGLFWDKAFHKETLKQICAVRAGLFDMADSDTVILLRAIMLGCLHGPRLKDIDNPSYFSNQMPRTFSTKPDYSIRYWANNNMKADKIDIRIPIRKKFMRLETSQYSSSSQFSNIINGDSRNYCSYSNIEHPINLVITSPPYYGMRTYIQDQWLRNWFLGGPETVDYICDNQINHLSQFDFTNSLSKAWDNVYNVADDNIKMVIRFGAISSRNVCYDSIIMESLSKSAGNWYVYRRKDVGSSILGKRQAEYMGAGGSPPVSETDYYVKLN